MAWVICRAINGIPLNGKEYVLNNDGNEMKFESIVEAKEYLAAHGVTEWNIESGGIEFEEVD